MISLIKNGKLCFTLFLLLYYHYILVFRFVNIWIYIIILYPSPSPPLFHVFHVYIYLRIYTYVALVCFTSHCNYDAMHTQTHAISCSKLYLKISSSNGKSDKAFNLTRKLANFCESNRISPILIRKGIFHLIENFQVCQGR